MSGAICSTKVGPLNDNTRARGSSGFESKLKSPAAGACRAHMYIHDPGKSQGFRLCYFVFSHLATMLASPLSHKCMLLPELCRLYKSAILLYAFPTTCT